MTPIIIFLTAIALGFLTAGIAKWKGRREMSWLLYGMVGSVVAIPILLTLDRRESEKSRSPWVWYLAAVVILALIAVLVIYRIQNARAF